MDEVYKFIDIFNVLNHLKPIGYYMYHLNTLKLCIMLT